MGTAARCRAAGLYVGLTACFAMAHTSLYSFAFPLLPVFTLIGMLFAEWAEPHAGRATTASLRTRRMWHHVPAGAAGRVVVSFATVAALRPLPEVGPILTGPSLAGIEHNSVRNNVYIGLWSIGIAVGLAAIALWLLTRARATGAERRRVGTLIGAFTATMATAVLTAETLWLGTANYDYEFGGNPWLGLALTAVGMAGLIAFAWYAAVLIRSPEPAPAEEPAAQANRVSA
jgi:hypothetical protein